MTPSFALDTTVRGPSYLARLAVVLFLLSGGAFTAAGALDKAMPTASLALLGGGAAALVAFFVLIGLASRRRPARVHVGETGIHFGAREIPRASIASGYFVPAAGSEAAHVRLLGARGNELARIDVDGEHTAQRILSTLGLGAAQHTASFLGVAPLKSLSTVALLAGMVGGLTLFTASLPLHLVWLSVLSMAAAIAAPIAFVPAYYRVGADGLLIDHRLGARFLPWDQVTSIEPYGRGVVLGTRSGAEELPLTSRFKLFYDYERAAQAALLSRARGALDAFRRGDASDLSARLARRGRSRDAWLAALTDASGDFRTAPLVDEALYRVVESPIAPATARAAAALLLARSRPGEPEADRDRLRIAAGACAAPRLRVVLDCAADGGTEERIQEALAEVEDAQVIEHVASKSDRDPA